MKFETTKNRFNLIRKIFKSIIVILWLFTFFLPFLIIREISPYPIADTPIAICWGGYLGDFSPHPLYWLFFAIFQIGFFLNFANIKRNYKNKLLNNNLGNFSGGLILIGGIGIDILIYTVLTYSDLPLEFDLIIGPGMAFPIIIAFLVFGVTYVINRVKIIQEKKGKEIIKEEPTLLREREISGKIFCNSCGEEIVDKSGGFCSKCGAPIK